MSSLIRVVDQFDIAGKLLSIIPVKRGRINDTFLSSWAEGAKESRYIHQKINHHVFHDVPGLMRNIELVTGHIRQKLADAALNTPIEDRAVCVVPTRSGGSYYQDDQGEFWRTYVSIEQCHTYDLCPSRQIAVEAAKACARFDKMLMDLDSKRLVETIPGFHNVAGRFQVFNDAIERNEFSRVNECKADIDFALKRVEEASLISRGLNNGSIPSYSVHNDTKLNNILFSKESGRGIGIVDLDTCMAGSWLYDFGDLTKHLVVIGHEDEQDLTKVGISLEYFSGAVQGYLEEMGQLMTSAQVDLLVNSLKSFALVLGVRFMTDYLQGDTYFKTDRPGQNLHRARHQFKLVVELDRHEKEMERIVRQFAVG